MQEEHGTTPPLEQAEPTSDPDPAEAPTVPGTLRPVSRLQAADPQDHAGVPERAPYEIAADGDTLGLDHIRVALADLPWPRSREDLVERAGRWRIPTTGTHFHVLADYLVDVDKDSFRSPDELVQAIARAHPELRR